MKKLAISFFVIILGLYAADRIGGKIMFEVNRKTKDVLAPKLQYIENNIHEDIVFIGNSRCHNHYVPSIIEDIMGMSVYNAGVGGADNIYSDYIVLCHLLNRYSPKIICLEISPTDYNKQKNPFSATSLFAPLFGNSQRADSIYHLAGDQYKYSISHLYRYNAKASSNLWGLILNRQKNADNGYMPLPKPKQFPTKVSKEEQDTTIDHQKMEYLHRFYYLCKANGIKLIFTVAPKFTIISNSHYKIPQDFAKEHDIPFMDYHTRGLYLNHPDYFKDQAHLWDKGARHYSSVFAHDMKRLLQIGID